MAIVSFESVIYFKIAIRLLSKSPADETKAIQYLLKSSRLGFREAYAALGFLFEFKLKNHADDKPMYITAEG